MKDNEFKSNRHSIYNLKYHLVVITKYRHKCINKEILNDLNEIFKNIIEGKNGTLIEFNGEQDHVHLLFEVPPQVELSKLVNTSILSSGGSFLETQYKKRERFNSLPFWVN